MFIMSGFRVKFRTDVVNIACLGLGGSGDDLRKLTSIRNKNP